MAANRVDAGRVQDLRRTKLVGTLGPAPGSPESLLDSFSK
jgi:pyruvate kinase